MKNKGIPYIMLVAVAIMLFSCEKQEIILVIDTEVQPILDNFIAEASIRGKTIDLDDHMLTISITEINRQDVAGQCTHSEGTISQILIDQEYWRGYTDLEKEALVFHELGHCILKRDHRDDQDANGNCISIMESGAGNCNMRYTIQNRETYLDELFSE